MKVKSLLAQAAKCVTEQNADNLLETLKRVFSNARPLSRLTMANEEGYMEGDKAFVRFELNREISDHYVTMIRPEIRDDTLVVVVVTNRMLDGHGMQSKSWEVFEEMEEVIEGRPDQTVAELARLAANCAIADHRKLIERVGVPPAVAKLAAKKSW